MLATRVAASFLWTERFGSRNALVVWFCLQYVEFFSMFSRVRATAHLRLQDDDVACAACAVPPRPRPSLRAHAAAPPPDTNDDWRERKDYKD